MPMAPVQLELIFEQDIEALSSMELHEMLMAESITLEQLERIAAALPGADRLMA